MEPIRVSFKQDETGLYNDIMKECSIYGKANWMKVAAIEKIQRDKVKTNNIQQNKFASSTTHLPIYNELTDLFKS